MHGFLLIDKPAGITSMDVIRRLRKVLNTRKIGHTGTLDPAATGMLVVTVGACTKLAKYAELEPKVYEFEIVFGTLTETADDEGDVVESGRSDVGEEEVRAVLEEFEGEILQRPPRYSAVKVDGKRAYELARAGVEFELPARPVTIHALTLQGIANGVASMSVRCGTGTYVRSLAVDIAARLGTVAHARGIRRVVVGPWQIDQARALESVDANDLQHPVGLLGGLPQVELDEAQETAVRYGQSIDGGETPLGHVALVRGGELIAVSEWVEGRLQPRRVLDQSQ